MAINLRWGQGNDSATLFLGEVGVAEITVDRRSNRTPISRTLLVDINLPGSEGLYRAGNMTQARERAEAEVRDWLTKAGVA